MLVQLADKEKVMISTLSPGQLPLNRVSFKVEVILIICIQTIIIYNKFIHNYITYQNIFELYIPMDKALGVEETNTLSHVKGNLCKKRFS